MTLTDSQRYNLFCAFQNIFFYENLIEKKSKSSQKLNFRFNAGVKYMSPTPFGTES